MQVLVFSDLHCHPHRAFATYPDGLNSRLSDSLRVLDQVREIAKSCDLVLFGGDLFHATPPPSVTFNMVYDRIGELASLTPVAMLAGNHDLRTKVYQGEQNEIPFLKLQDCPGVTLLEVAFPELLTFNSRDDSESVTVYGVNHRRLGDLREILKEAPAADICLIHQNVLGASVGRFVFPEGVDYEETAKFGWTFCGHIHQPQRLGDRFIIPGAPLHINFSDSGDRGVWVLDTKQQTVRMISTKFPRFVTVGSEQEVAEDGNFYRVEEIKEEKTDALTLPGLEESVTEYVREKAASKEVEKVGLSLMEQIPEKVVTPSDLTIDEVRVENFTVFEEASFSAEDGLYLVIGEAGEKEGRSNGSGKTSLFEAISWALYGLTSKGERGLAVMRRGLGRGGTCLVEVVLHSLIHGTMSVTRTQTKSGSSLRVRLGERVEEGDIRVVQQWLTDTLGVSYEFFRQMVYFSQESVDFFSAMGDADKKRILGNLLGLTHYDDAHQLAKKKRDAATEMVTTSLREVETIQGVIESLHGQVETLGRRRDEWESGRQERVTLMESRIQTSTKEITDARQLQDRDRSLVLSTAREARGALDEDTKEQRLSLEFDLKAQKEGLKEKLSRRRQEIEPDLLKWAESLKGVPDSQQLQVDCEAVRGSLAEVVETKLQLDHNQAVALSAVTVRQNQIASLEIKVGKIDRLEEGTKCPTCGGDVTPESKCRCLEEIQGEIAGLREQNQGSRADADQAGLDVKVAREEIERLQGLMRGFEVSLHSRRVAEQKVDRLQMELGSLDEELTREMSRLDERHTYEEKAIDTGVERGLELIDEKEKSGLQRVDVQAESRIESLRRSISEVEMEAKRLQEESSPFTQTLEEQQAQLTERAMSMKEAEARKGEAGGKLKTFEFWVKGFGREGIPAALLQGFCRLFTCEVNDVLSQMNIGVSVELSASTTLKSGELRDRLDYVIRTRTGESTYKMLSGGEKTRVDLTSMLVLNLLASRRFGIKNGLFGVLILDELFSSLDSEGCELVYEILSRFQSRTVFVITHSGELKALFDNVILVRKTGDTSVVV